MRREERLEHHVKVKPDLGLTDVDTIRVDSSTVLLRVTPRDKFGNYLGPGYGSIVKAKLNSEGTLSTGDPIDRDQTGTYEFTVTGVPAGETPDLDITVDGTGVSNPISDGTASGKWRWFLDARRTFPHDDILKHFGGDWSINGGVERRLSANWSVEAILGYHRFGNVVFDDPHLWQLSIGGKRFFGSRRCGRSSMRASAGTTSPSASAPATSHASEHMPAPACCTRSIHASASKASSTTTSSTTDNDSLGFSTLQIGVRVGF